MHLTSKDAMCLGPRPCEVGAPLPCRLRQVQYGLTGWSSSATTTGRSPPSVFSRSGCYRHRMLIRVDGAGFSHGLLEHIASGGEKRGRRWEFSVGWPRTDRKMDAIAKLPAAAWTPGDRPERRRR